MVHDLSPAVERAAAAVGNGTLADWFLALTADEDGQPAAVLTRIGADVATLRQTAERVATPAPLPPVLYAAARERSLALRHDPAVTSEYLLLAVLEADAGFATTLTAAGLDLARLTAALDQTRPATDPQPGPEFVVRDAVEQQDAARVVDANLNRARESLRVLDDYCRFVLNDAVLTDRLKALRHDLAAAAKGVPVLAARDTPGDVGTAVSADGEYRRGSPAEVAAVNFKRLQESLRSVEEFGKVLAPELGRRAEAIRYTAYSLEPVVLSDARRRLDGVRLYALFTGSQCVASLEWTIAEAAAGGVQAVQLREKQVPDNELLHRARQVRRWTRAAGVLFIMNDRPDIARLAEADGVHLGQDDLPVAAARRVLGPDALIGVSTHTVEQVDKAVADGADYLGVGPTFPGTTKAFDHFPGLAFVQAAAARTSLPAFAIGGIQPDNVQRVVAAGLRRVAVSSAVATADDPRAVAATLRHHLNG
jgi:thiamine-phosphate pyrophosphorylase